MKNSAAHKILRLSISQILNSTGYTKTSSKAIDTFTDVTSQIIFTLTSALKNDFSFPLHSQSQQKIEHNTITDKNNIINASNKDNNAKIDFVLYILADKYLDSAIFSFLASTPYISLKGNSILQKLNIIPRTLDWKARGGGIFHDELFVSEDEMKSEFEPFVYNFAFDYNMPEETNDKYKLKIDNIFKNIITDDVGDKNNDVMHDKNIKSINNENTDSIINSNNIDYLNKFYADNKEVSLDSCIVKKITGKGSWMPEKLYKIILENRGKRRKMLDVYENELSCGVLDEIKALVGREVDKSVRE